MVINLITFASILHKQASVRSSHEVILTELEKYFTVNFMPCDRLEIHIQGSGEEPRSMRIAASGAAHEKLTEGLA